MPSAETARLIASLELKDQFSGTVNKALGGLATIDRRIDRTQSKAFQAGQHIGLGLRNTAKLAAGVTVAVGALGGGIFLKAIGSASHLSETISKVGVVFGKQGPAVLAFGKTSADALGLSENAADSAAATYGNLFVSMGLAQKKSAEMSVNLVKLASDLASFNDIEPDAALEKLRAGLTGEAEPLKTLGINLNEQTLKAKALELGLVKLSKGQKTYTAVLDPATKAQAAYALIMEQSKTAQGDFARTQDGLANQTRKFRAIWENLKTTLATPALPQIAKVLKAINAEITSNQPAIARLGDNIAGLFTDANIKQGIDALKGAFQVAKDAAPAIAGAAKITGQALKIAVDAFRSLPPDIQKIAIAGLAINKLTGGLVTNLAGGLIEAVVKRLVSAVVNVNGAVVNVNGLGVPGGAIPLGPGAAAAGTGLGIGTIAVGLAAGTAVAALGIMGLGWLIQATSSPEQFAATNLRAQQQERFKRSGGTQGALPGQLPTGTAANPIHVTASGFTAGFASSVTPGGFTAGFGVKGTGLFSGIVGTLKTSLTDAIKTGLRFHDREFYAAVAALKSARKPEDVQKAVAEALRLVVGQRRGNALATSRVLADLKGQLVHTTDPETRRILKAAIGQVEHKLAGRQLVQKQLDKADKILKSNESTKDKIRDLTAIQKSLASTSKSGQAKIQDKLDALKRATAAAGQQAAFAIRDKDLSLSLKSTTVVNAGFDIRTVIGGATTIRKFGNATTNISTKNSLINVPS